ncbi:MAG: AAA family ATPase [Elusimicrobia bacterium]|nr:AAA family ATPase [Elusimicrobiota bacterium]
MSSEKALRWVFFGKGGIGKSTISSAVCCELAARGHKVLRVGCDPKKDSSSGLMGHRPVVTYSELYCAGKVSEDRLIMSNEYGIDCVEAGGPEPGTGCAGRGVSLLLDYLNESGLVRRRGYDSVVYDVLGDVVCGGFAAPMRMGFADRAFIVLGVDLMSMLAANNIAKAVARYSANGVTLGGLIVNRVRKADHAPLALFSSAINSRVIGALPDDPAVVSADFAGEPVPAFSPGAPFTAAVRAAVGRMLALKSCPRPRPMSDAVFAKFKLELAARARAAGRGRAPK